MTCELCGARCQGRYCAGCEQIMRNEATQEQWDHEREHGIGRFADREDEK